MPQKSTAAVTFWQQVYAAKRGPLDVRAALDGIPARRWMEREGASYVEMWRHCEEYFATADPIPRSWLPEPAIPTLAEMPTSCPRCGGYIVTEADHYSRYVRCLTCGWHS